MIISGFQTIQSLDNKLLVVSLVLNLPCIFSKSLLDGALGVYAFRDLSPLNQSLSFVELIEFIFILFAFIVHNINLILRI
jgi:hypothetical protein